MNFISTFDELNKLYEEVQEEEKVEEACKEKLTEADEAPIEEPVVEEEPRQVICECDKCGALIIKDEADIVVDEETDLVNVEDECQFCEEAKGYKIIGVMVPYEAVEEETFDESDEAPEEPIEEAFESLKRIEWKKMKGKYNLTPVKGSEIKKGDLIIQAPAEQIDNLDDDDFAVYAMKVTQEGDETEIVWGGGNGTDYWTPDSKDFIKATKKDKNESFEEDLADVYRKTFDKPASIETQQHWEDELNGEMGEISDKRRKHLEKKFAQQRDWEARHAKDDEDLEELFDIKPSVSLGLHGGTGNDVSVLGH